MKRLPYLALLLALPALPASAMVARMPHACPAIAMLCPDGSSVSPTGPNCTMPSCPAPTLPGQAKPMPAQPPLPGVSAGSPPPPSLPDLPLAPPSGPQSVKFVVEHRSALDNQQVTVHGIVVAVQPLTLADSAEDTRNKAYDVEITLPDGDKTSYAKGQIVDIPCTVSGTDDAVTLQKN